MQIEIKPEQEWVVREALATGRYATADDFVADVLATAGEAAPSFSDKELQALTQVAVDRGGYRERGPDWKAEILAMAEQPRASAS